MPEATDDGRRKPWADYERTDARPRALAWFAAAFSFFLLLSLALCLWIYAGWFGGRPVASLPEEMAGFASGSGRISAVEEDRRRLEEEAAARLSSFGWVDREAGIARIPVEAAMELIARRGLPSWRNSESEPQTP